MSQEILSTNAAVIILCVFAVVMFSLVAIKTHAEKHTDGFLLADRKLSPLNAAFSIAVSWIWAPAIFVCSMQAYTNGLPGIFWFTLPNIICFFVFAPLAIRLRREMPHGYTLPEYVAQRFKDHKKLHIIYVVVFFGNQLFASIVNPLAAGYLLHAVSGIDMKVTILSMCAIALSYSLFSGLKASVFTDVLQMSMILLIGFILVPLCFFSLDGNFEFANVIGGVHGKHSSLFDPWIAFSMGIPMTLALITGPVSDQMFFQRAFAVQEKHIVKTFVTGGLIFGLVPIILSLLGFIGASLVQQGAIVVNDPQVVGVLVINHLLPKAAVYAFCFMAFAGLCSTMDSAFCATSSIGAIDIYKRYFNPGASDSEILKVSRLFMLALAVFGSAVALLEPKLMWLLLIYGCMTSAAFVPTVLALYYKSISATGMFWAITLSLIFGLPLSVYANVNEDPYLTVLAAIASVGISLLVCLGFECSKIRISLKVSWATQTQSQT